MSTKLKATVEPKTRMMKNAPAVEKKGNALKWAMGGALLAALVIGVFLLTNGGCSSRSVIGGGAALPAVAQGGPDSPVPVNDPTLVKGSAILQVSSEPTGAEAYLDKYIKKDELGEQQAERERGEAERLATKRKAALQLIPTDMLAKAGLSKAQRLVPTVHTDPMTGMAFVLVKGGCYLMGSNSGDSDDNPVHKVCVDDFYLGKYEVTQAQYEKMTGSNPSNLKGNDRPVELVNWDDAQSYLRILNNRSGKSYRLPTEAEWEFAARSGGRDETYEGTSGESSLGDYTWYGENSGKQTHPVGQKRANNLGLYDMTGNVWEWCSDWYESGYYGKSPRNNPQGAGSGSVRVIRGGSWYCAAWHTQTTFRGRVRPGSRDFNMGFRVAFPARY
jgi:sulfatase modifying factor 1